MLKNLRIAMGVCVLLLVLLGLGMLHFHQRALAMEAQENTIDQSIAKIQREEQGYQLQMQQPANARVLTQAQFLNHLFDEKSFSWTAAMEDLERVLPPGEQVTAIEPTRGKDGRLTLKLRVTGLRERSVEMVRNMERSKRFLTPRISGENAETSSQGELQQVSGPGRVSFDILAEYNPPTLAERQAEIATQKRVKTVPSLARPMTPPRYIPPNPQMPRPMPPVRRAPVVEAEPEEPPPGTPPLHNHDSNRNRPMNSTVPDANGGGPQ